MANQVKFDFNAYNGVMHGAGAGLKLMLTEQLLEDVLKTCRRFNNPLKKEISDLLDEVSSIRVDWKKQAELSQRQTQGEPGTAVKSENAPVATA